MNQKLFARVLGSVTAIFVALFFYVPAQANWFGAPAPDFSQSAANTYYCANPSGSPVTTQAGVSLSSPTISLFNPNGSGKNLVVLDVGVKTTAIPGAFTNYFLAYNVAPSSGALSYTATATQPIVTGAQVGKSTGTFTTAVGVCRIQGTLPPTPVAFRYIGSVSSNTVSSVYDETDGKVVVPPGGLISIQASAAMPTLAHISWREDPGN